MNKSFFAEVDTQHLPLPYSDEKFTVSSAHLIRLFEQCHYRTYGEIVLFGIRAAQTFSPKGEWLTEITIAENKLDYEYLNCLLGLWDKKNHKIAIFQGSTVPFIEHLLKQQSNPSLRLSNQLFQGSYHYFVGAHEPDSRPKEEGAFRLNRHIPTPVWRDYGDNNIVLDVCKPNDHIHAAGTIDTEYRSAGCQVIAGFHDELLPVGEYQKFRILAGQSALPSDLEIHLPYQYILMHSRHLRAIQKGYCLERLMQGSEGAEVRQLQEQLIAEGYLAESIIDKGMMCGESIRAVYEKQKANHLVIDGIHRIA